MSPPTSRPPAGVPQGGNAKYAIVAVVLLIGIVALVALRVCSKPAEPAASLAATATASQVAPPPPTNPKLDDIPPPPPAEEVVEAGPAGPRILTAAGPPPGCDSRCSPSFATPELQAAISVRGQQARRCYNQALSRDPSLKGHVNIAVRIGPSGNVCSANVSSNDMSSAAVANCAANILRSATYPAPRGGCVEANVPLSFVAQGQ